jgi:hypothetical protein
MSYYLLYLTKFSAMQEKVLGIIRHILTFGGGFLVAKGLVDLASLDSIIGAIVTLTGSIWSVAAKK